MNIDAIDRQHKKLFVIINQLYDEKQSFYKDRIVELLGELVDYANLHFKSEELVFKRVQYPASSDHVGKHSLFWDKIKEVAREYKHNEYEEIPDQLFRFLKEWIKSHILKQDREYAAFINKMENETIGKTISSEVILLEKHFLAYKQSK